MLTSHQIHHWLWRWHIIAGLLTLPFLFLLATTGAIYLFKAPYEANAYQHITTITPTTQRLSYQAQWNIAQQAAKENGMKSPAKMVLPAERDQATQFIAGRFSSSNYLFVNPYTGGVTGQYAQRDTLMHKVRKLHGELLLGKKASLIIELVASWLVVLIVTGLYLFWPRSKATWLSVLRIRYSAGKRTLYRDVHSVTGFWLSLALLLVLAGGLPWTEVFGNNFKALRDYTATGYPKGFNGKGYTSVIPDQGDPLSIDQVVEIAEQYQLPGTITLSIPKKREGIYSISNRAVDLHAQRRIHIDQYSGEVVAQYGWESVGALSHSRQIVMRIHQGELFGKANWLMMLAISLLTAILSLAALISYWLRKPANSWGLPTPPNSMKVGLLLWLGIGVLGITLPLFGLSAVAIALGSTVAHKIKQRRQPLRQST